MLSFDLSAIDVVLLVAMLVLFLLIITQKRSPSAAEPRLGTNDQERVLKMSKETGATTTERPLKMQPADGFQKCVHQFGYLRTMPKNTPIPDECFGCPKVLRCMFPKD
jgi:hypothetical protein